MEKAPLADVIDCVTIEVKGDRLATLDMYGVIAGVAVAIRDVICKLVGATVRNVSEVARARNLRGRVCILQCRRSLCSSRLLCYRR